MGAGWKGSAEFGGEFLIGIAVIENMIEGIAECGRCRITSSDSVRLLVYRVKLRNREREKKLKRTCWRRLRYGDRWGRAFDL